jgi:hypothetical protein
MASAEGAEKAVLLVAVHFSTEASVRPRGPRHAPVTPREFRRWEPTKQPRVIRKPLPHSHATEVEYLSDSYPLIDRDGDHRVP